MARKRQPTVPKRATLQMPRSEVKARIRKQIEAGQKLLTAYELMLSGQNAMIRKYAEAGLSVPETWLRDLAERRQQLKEKKKWWSDHNVELLKRIVDTDELVNAYYYSTFEGGLLTGEESGDDIKDSIASLESIFNL